MAGDERQDDTMVTGDWPPLEVDWGKEYKTLDDYELDSDGMPVYVKVTPVEAQQARRLPPEPGIWPDPPNDDGARLDTPANHRQKAIGRMSDELERAIAAGEKAREWAESIGYDREEKPVLLIKLNRGIDALVSAFDDLERFK